MNIRCAKRNIGSMVAFPQYGWFLKAKEDEDIISSSCHLWSDAQISFLRKNDCSLSPLTLSMAKQIFQKQEPRSQLAPRFVIRLARRRHLGGWQGGGKNCPDLINRKYSNLGDKEPIMEMQRLTNLLRTVKVRIEIEVYASWFASLHNSPDRCVSHLGH